MSPESPFLPTRKGTAPLVDSDREMQAEKYRELQESLKKIALLLLEKRPGNEEVHIVDFLALTESPLLKQMTRLGVFLGEYKTGQVLAGDSFTPYLFTLENTGKVDDQKQEFEVVVPPLFSTQHQIVVLPGIVRPVRVAAKV